MNSAQKPGWYWQEGLLPGQKRYWNGQSWTARVSAPTATGSTSVAWGIVLAVLIIGAVAFGALNLMANVSRV